MEETDYKEKTPVQFSLLDETSTDKQRIAYAVPEWVRVLARANLWSDDIASRSKQAACLLTRRVSG